MNPTYPIYIPSKGRWKVRLTSARLTQLRIPHMIVVEEQERAAYAAATDPRYTTLLVLDPDYKRSYELCDDLGLTRTTGSGPARNFIWDHAVSIGAPYHWIMDDNIGGFHRLNYNMLIQVVDGTALRVMELFVERYDNVAMAGPQYYAFAPRKSPLPPFVPNRRIYSCILIRNDIPFRWRARYNEDTDLSLRVLKAGWCTVLFNAFIQDKATTQTMTGGNTDELYAQGTLDKSRMIAELHPDVAEVVWKYGRWHHNVNYDQWRFRPLHRRDGVVISSGVDNFGLVLEQRVNGRWVSVVHPDQRVALGPQPFEEQVADAVAAVASGSVDVRDVVDWVPDEAYFGQLSFDAAWGIAS